jgi:hypothetical protein
MAEHDSPQQPHDGREQEHNDGRDKEVHTEREIIVTGGGGRSSGLSTAVVAVVALLALAVIVFVGFALLDRDGDLIPSDININVETPNEDEENQN